MTGKWTDEHGAFSVGTDKGWDLGTWRQAGVSGGGYASAQVWRYHDGSCLVGVHACANMTPAQARQLARVLSDAADKADAEDASPAMTITATGITKVCVRYRRDDE